MPTSEERAPTVYAALLRGVNVGGKAKVPMAELRLMLEELGHREVRTYLNSGNAVFSSPSADEDVLGAQMEQAIERRFGFPVSCLVRSGGYLRAVAEANPYAEQAAAGGKTVHATFLSAPVGPELLETVPPERFRPDEYHLGERVLYLHLPNGLGRSKLAEALARPSAQLKGVTATTRNWNTVAKLVELTGA